MAAGVASGDELVPPGELVVPPGDGVDCTAARALLANRALVAGGVCEQIHTLLSNTLFRDL